MTHKRLRQMRSLGAYVALIAMLFGSVSPAAAIGPGASEFLVCSQSVDTQAASDFDITTNVTPRRSFTRFASYTQDVNPFDTSAPAREVSFGSIADTPEQQGLASRETSDERVKYPIRGSWWSGCETWQHMDSGEHRGKFDRSWLASLSWQELQSLHSDDHDGRLKLNHVVLNRPTASPYATVSLSHDSCPAGGCPMATSGGHAVQSGIVFRRGAFASGDGPVRRVVKKVLERAAERRANRQDRRSNRRGGC